MNSCYTVCWNDEEANGQTKRLSSFIKADSRDLMLCHFFIYEGKPISYLSLKKKHFFFLGI